MNDHRDDEFRKKYNYYYDEEYSAELTDGYDYDVSSRGDATHVAIMVGIIGLATAVASFFMHPLILGAISIGTGIFAAHRGAKILGALVIGVGIISLLFYFLNFSILT